jgi:hypothetical protein
VASNNPTGDNNMSIESEALRILERIVDWYGLRDGVEDELLPLEEQPREIQDAMRLIEKAHKETTT